MVETDRSENEIFAELESICTSPGYVHVIAYLCFRDNMVGFDSTLEVEDLQQMFSQERLIRTEMSTLIGLMVRGPIDYDVPSNDEFSRLVSKSDELLAEIHVAMTSPILESLRQSMASGQKPETNIMSTGAAIRESIFYAAESAYNFQYREIAPYKYREDAAWIRHHKGFDLESAARVADFLGQLVSAKVTQLVQSRVGEVIQPWACLSGFSFTALEVTNALSISENEVRSILDAFCLPANSRNDGFTSLDSFNLTNATPIISGPSCYILFQPYALCESLYESPFYWMASDKAYKDQAMANRGHFTEIFAAERLSTVFGEKRVYQNLKFVGGTGSVLGEVDVLVRWGDRAIVVQAKSKKLTLEARKGNDNQLQADFKRSVQDSYDQAFSCAQLLSTVGCRVIDSSGTEVRDVKRNLKSIYLFCVVSDHYPSLSFQSRQFLVMQAATQVHPPFIIDIFTLDVLTEMLDSPLRFLSYIDKRSTYDDQLHAGHELTILAFHLRQNLWLDDEYNMVMLQDDISSTLDIAMLVRRAGVAGDRTPSGILTQFAGTRVGSLIDSIEQTENSKILDFGFLLLTLSGESLSAINQGLIEIVRLSRKDGFSHDFTLGICGGKSGLTIHSSYEERDLALAKLINHCERRKYRQHASTWYGICIDPMTEDIRFGVNMDAPWAYDDRLEQSTKLLKPPMKTSFVAGQFVKRKVGRNEICPCGSGKKYKHCCLRLH